jgi:hypothetical protein
VGVVLAGVLAGAYFLLSSCFGGDEPQQEYSDAGVSDTASGGSPQTVASRDPEDVTYLATLQQRSASFGSEAAMIEVGHSICNDLATGQWGPLDLGVVIMNTDQVDAAQAGYIVGAAINSYCPEYA